MQRTPRTFIKNGKERCILLKRTDAQPCLYVAETSCGREEDNYPHVAETSGKREEGT